MPAVTLTPTTARVMDGRKVMSEAPVVRSQAFQFTDGEARAAPDVVTGMISSRKLLYYVACDIDMPC